MYVRSLTEIDSLSVKSGAKIIQIKLRLVMNFCKEFSVDLFKLISMELEIEVLWHTDETRKLSDAGMEFDPESLERKTVTFYHIDAIAPDNWKWDGVTHEFCKITAGGEVWISAYDYESTKQIISSARRLTT